MALIKSRNTWGHNEVWGWLVGVGGCTKSHSISFGCNTETYFLLLFCKGSKINHIFFIWKPIFSSDVQKVEYTKIWTQMWLIEEVWCKDSACYDSVYLRLSTSKVCWNWKQCGGSMFCPFVYGYDIYLNDNFHIISIPSGTIKQVRKQIAQESWTDLCGTESYEYIKLTCIIIYKRGLALRFVHLRKDANVVT